MVRERVLVPLLAAAAALVIVGFSFFVAPFAFFERCCPGPEDHGASPAPGPGGEGDAAAVACLRVPRAVQRAVSFAVGVLTGSACLLCYDWLADRDEEEDEAPGAAKKAGYFAIAAAGLEAGTGAGCKMN